MSDNILRPDDWARAARSEEFAEYIRQARERFLRGEAVTVRKVRALFRRVAEELRREIERVTPGTLRYSHLVALTSALDRAARTINDEVMAAVLFGIELAVEEATDGAEQVMMVLVRDIFLAAEVKELFAAVNRRAVLAVLSRTYHDGLRLSDRVWRVSDHARQAVTRLVEDAVARGLDARTLARQVQRYLQPGVWTPLKEETRRRLGVPKDISMEALRLAVSEMQHAFHEGTILGYRNVPSCRGFYWRLSSAHGVVDICDTYARHNGNGFWEAGNVPPKPHPWCRCVLVPAMEEPSQFVQRLKAWVNDPSSQPDIEQWYLGVQQYLRRPTFAA